MASNATFKEIARVVANPTTDIVFSTVTEGTTLKGININKYIKTATYTGFTKDGCFVPAASIKDFQAAAQKMG